MEIQQDTTTNVDINYQGGPFGGGRGGRTGGRTNYGADEDEMKDSDRDKLAGADQDVSKRGRAVVRLQSLPNGEYPIRNASDLRAVIKEWQSGLKTDSYSGYEVQRHIIKRARDLKLVALLPTEWGVNFEELLDQMALQMPMTIEQLEAESRFFSAKIRRKYAQTGVAMSDGSFPIPDKDALRRAVKLVGKKPGAKSHIIKRAKALGATGMLPEDWKVTAEKIEEKELVQEIFQSFLLAEGKTVPAIEIIQEASNDNNQTMRVKVPFYIGDSISHAPGFTKPVIFPTGILQETVKSGKDDIAANTQPLTVYGRHAHAADASYLPIGAVVDLEQEGNIGYAILEVEPTSVGKDIQILARAKKLNAVSLRASKGRFEMEDVTVNGERMHRMTNLRISGIDFAPDSPAMKTYGIQVLQENADIKPIKKEEKTTKLDNLTLEELRSSHSDLVAKIEEPLVARLDEETKKVTTLTAEVADLKSYKVKREIADYASEIASKHPEPDKALPILMEIAKDCKSKEEFSVKVFPIVMEALSGKTDAITVVETAETRLRKLFGLDKPNGKGEQRQDKQGDLTQEEEEEFQGGHVGPLEVPA